MKSKIYIINVINTNDSKPKIMFYSENSYEQVEIKEFLSHIKKIGKKNTNLFSLNLNFLIVNLIKHGILKEISNETTNTLLFKGQFYYLRILQKTKKKKTFTIRSFKNFFPYNIETLNSKFNVHFEKINQKFKENKDIDENETSIKSLKNNSQFAVILLNKFYEATSLFYISTNSNIYTISGTSLIIFKRFYNNYYVDFKQDRNTYEIFNKAFYGGRNEVVGNPLQNEFTYYYDYPSMYANIMREEEFWYGEYEEVSKPQDCIQPGFYYIHYTSNMKFPVLPQKSVNYGLIFPNGSYLEGLYWFELISLFIKEGGKIESIEKGYILRKKNYIFRNFCEELLTLRSKNDFNKNIYKSILVSFYGRLGFNPKKSKSMLLSSESYNKIISWDYEIIQEIWIDNFVIIEIINNETSQEDNLIEADVKIAAQITSKAQIKLFNLIKKITKTGIRVLYYDTDSIFIASQTNIDDQIIADIKWEKKMAIKEAIFISTKTYGYKTWDNREVKIIAGIQNEFKVLSLETMRICFYFNEELKLAIKKKLNNFQFQENNIILNLSFNQYKKRKFTSDKKNTTPLKLKQGFLEEDYFANILNSEINKNI